MLCVLLMGYVESHRKVECVIKGLLSHMSFADNIIENIEEYWNETDYSKNFQIHKENMHRFIYKVDLRTQREIEDLLINYPVQNIPFKRAIAGCNLKMDKVIQNCNKKYKEGCEMLHPFAAVKKCPKDYFRLGFRYCVPLCPSGFDNIENDGFACSKSLKSNRSETFSENFNTTLISYKNLIWMYDCPKHYKRIDNDICIRQCPFAWEDLGDRCKKPHLDQREYEAFYYLFAYDDEEISQDLRGIEAE